MLLFSIPYTS